MYKGETMKENKEFALKVKSIRERQNMSIEELAEKSDVKLDLELELELFLMTHHNLDLL